MATFPPRARVLRDLRQRQFRHRATRGIAALAAPSTPYLAEWLEPRMLLAGGIGPIGTLIDPSAAAQVFFPPDQSTMPISANPTGPAALFYKFAVDSSALSIDVDLSLKPTAAAPGSDAALALYDLDGNLLTSVDADSIPNQPGQEHLAVSLYRGEPYILGVYFAPAGPPLTYELTVEADAQLANPTISVNPLTGAAQFKADSGENSFNAPADVDYYPIDPLNIGSFGAVTVKTLGTGQLSAMLFRRTTSDQPWRPIASGSTSPGKPMVLGLFPPAGTNVNDADYLLATAPFGLNTGTQAYQIDVAAESLLSPASIPAAGSADLGPMLPMTLSEAGIVHNATMGAAANVFKFRSAASGDAQLSLSTSTFQPVLSIYTADGSKLLGVASVTSPGTAALNLPLLAGATYQARVADIGQDSGGAFTCSASMFYSPQSLILSGDTGTFNIGQLGAAQPPAFYRVYAGMADVLVVSLEGGAAATLGLAGIGMAAQKTATVGQSLFLSADITGAGGVFDIGIFGNAAAAASTLRIGRIDLPETLNPQVFPGDEVNLNGDFALGIAGGAFGQYTGRRFYQLMTEPSLPTILQAQGTGGAMPLVAHYQRTGSLLKLKSFALPSDAGFAKLSSLLPGDELNAVAVFSMSFDGSGFTAVLVNGPFPQGVGVAMAPEPPPDLPQNPTPPSGPYQSVLKIDQVTLNDEYEQHLWQTTLPANMLTLPSITLTPGGKNLAVRLSTYDHNRELIDTRTGVPGQTLNFTLPNTTVAALKGKSLLFRVEAIDGVSTGNGLYSLHMSVQTANPHPFEVLEPKWRYPGKTPIAGIPSFPVGEKVVDILQNEFGDGLATGSFTSSTPNTKGSVDVYRFWVVNPGPLSVRTVPIDPAINTNLKLYRAHFVGEGTGQPTDEIDYLTEVDQVGPSFDWFPADRTQIDAQVLVQDFELLRYKDFVLSRQYETGGGMYFAVVKNQEGTLGKYRIQVDAPDFTTLGGIQPSGTIEKYHEDPTINYDDAEITAVNNQVAYLPQPGGGPVQLNLNYVEGIRQFVGYFPIHLSEHHDGTLKVSSGFQTRWDFQLFNSDGEMLPGSFADFSTAAGDQTRGTFSVPGGAQTVWLRVRERDVNANANSHLFISIGEIPPVSPTSPPPATLTAGTISAALPTSALVDGQMMDAMTANGQVKTYAFRAPSDAPITFSIVPLDFDDFMVRWGIYVNGQRIAWNQTLPASGDNSQRTSTTIILPRLQPADAQGEYPYNRSPYNDVVVRVQAASAPTGPGRFTVAVNSQTNYPLGNVDLRINPLTAASVQQPVTGLDWVRLAVPDAPDEPVKLRIQPQWFGTSSAMVGFDLYDVDGSLVATGKQGASSQYPAIFDLPAAVKASTYYLRSYRIDDVSAPLKVSATVSLPKIEDLYAGDPPVPIMIWAKPPAEQKLFDDPPYRLSPPPDGKFFQGFDKSTTAMVANAAFWVEEAGKFSLSAGLGNAPNPYVALYKARLEKKGEIVAAGDYKLDLIDFTNLANGFNSGNYYLDAYLDPGLYVIKVFRSGMTGDPNTPGIALLNFSVPPYPVQEIVLDPNSGSSITPQLALRDVARGRLERVESYRSTFYHVIAPPGSQAGLQALVQNLTYPGDPGGVDDALLAVYGRQSEQSPYYRITSPGDTPVLNPPSFPAPATVSAQVSAPSAAPQTQYWIALHRNNLATEALVSATFAVPQSGTPDLLVESIKLLPNNGQTRVEVLVRNNGYALAQPTTSRFQFSDTSKTPAKWTTADLMENALGPFASRLHVFDWTPVRTTDEVRYSADFVDGKSAGDIAELNEVNNVASKLLSTVDAHAPVVSISLADPTLDGNPDPDVWGRYISGVPSWASVWAKVNYSMSDADDLADTDGDGASDVWRATGSTPYFGDKGNNLNGAYFYFGPAPEKTVQYEFGSVGPTGPKNPNQFRLIPRDKYGLPGQEVVKTLQVVSFPGWLDNEDSTIQFNKETHEYDIEYHTSVLDVQGTLDQLTGFTIPLMGDMENRFLHEVNATASVSLNPLTPIVPEVTGHTLVKVLDRTVINKTWPSTTKPTNKLNFISTLNVNSLTVEADALAFTFKLDNLELLNYQSPKIPLGVPYGIPGVASISANLSFTLNANLDAALSVAIDPSTPPNAPKKIGMVSPTYVSPTLKAAVHLSGDIELVGLDVASLGGYLALSLTPTYGLTTPTTQLVPVSSFAANSALNLTGSISGGLYAEIMDIEVWSYDLPSYNFNGGGGPPVIKGAAAAPEANPPAPIITTWPGTAPVGSVVADPHPGIVIDPSSGRGLYIQALDVNSDPNVTRANLAFSQRVGGAWSPLTTLPTASHVLDPVLALTHDGPSAPAVVVYGAFSETGDPALKSRNSYFSSQDMRWRYFDGTAWGAEQILAADNLFDSQPAVAFNSAGQGALAWVKNRNPAPIDTAGTFDRSANEIAVATWNAATHAWNTPQTLTANSISDSQPAVVAAPNGTLYVFWLRDEASGGADIMFSSNNGSGWSVPAQLPLDSSLAGGKVEDLTVGMDASGQLRIVFTFWRNQPGQTPEAKLLSIATSSANLVQPAPFQVIAENTRFTALHMVGGNDGSLVLYGQSSDGRVNGIFTSRLAPAAGAAGGAWSAPVPLTSDAGFEMSPSLAIDTDGRYQLVHEIKPSPATPPGYAPPPGSSQPENPVGIPTSGPVGTSSRRVAPELGFVRPIQFPDQTIAPSGATVDAMATIINSGLAGDQVLVQYLVGESVVDSQIVFLTPSATLDLRHAFTIQPGATYSIRLTPLGGVEAVGSLDNTSSTTIAALPDIELDHVALSDPAPQAGDTIQIQARIHNASDMPIDSFIARFYQGDPTQTHTTPLVLGEQVIRRLDPFQSMIISFPWTVPADGGQFMLAVRADADKTITEASEYNNDARVAVSILPDPAVAQPVIAQVLDYSGISNVEVTSRIQNRGHAPATNLPVRLYSSLDDGPLIDRGTQIIRYLGVGDATTLTWLADGLAGRNRFVVVANPDLTSLDSILENDTGETSVQIQGLPDLWPRAFTLNPAAPVQGQPLTMSATIRNNGIATARNFLVEVYAGGSTSTGRLVGQAVIDVLDPLASTTIDIPIDTSLLVGPQNIILVVDPKATVLESTDLNNELAQRLIVSAGRLTADVADSAPFARSVPLDQITITFSQPVTGFDLSDISLVRGSAIPLDGAALEPIDGPTWILSGLTPLTSIPGDYTINVGGRASGIVGPDGNPLDAGASTSFRIEPSYSIQGRVFQDNNADGIYNEGEPVLPGRTIYIDDNRNGLLDRDEAFATTDGAGRYALPVSTGATYIVRLAPDAGWIQTSPAGAFHTITVSPGTSIIQTADFANFPAILRGTEADDTYNIRLDASGTLLEIFDQLPAGREPVMRIPIGLLPSLTFESEQGEDSLLIDLVNGNPAAVLPISLAGPGAWVLNILGGVFDLDSLSWPRTATPGVIVGSNSSVSVATDRALGVLHVDDGGLAVVRRGSIGLLSLGGVGAFGSGRLDLQDNDLLIHNAAYLDIAPLVASSRAARQRWMGPGIGTSLANADQGLALDQIGADVKIKFTWNGDLNLDGRVNADDYFYIDQGFLQKPQPPKYHDGDFNFDGKINADDYFLIDQAFLNQRGQALSAPKPASFAASPVAFDVVQGDAVLAAAAAASTPKVGNSGVFSDKPLPEVWD